MEIYLNGRDAKAMRLGLGLTLAQVAEESYLSSQELSQLENDARDNIPKGKYLLLQFVYEKLYSKYDTEEALARMAMGKIFGKRIKTQELYEHYLKELKNLKDG